MESVRNLWISILFLRVMIKQTNQTPHVKMRKSLWRGLGGCHQTLAIKIRYKKLAPTIYGGREEIKIVLTMAGCLLIFDFLRVSQKARDV